MPKIQELSIEDRIRLVEDIWDSIAVEATNIPLQDTQRRELNRRLDRYTLDGADQISAKDAIAEIRHRL